ncbi:GNAT family N-acetyltransferase [Bacillus massiliglaciei]|uniref:GNAT family N-acetyltransferase n=1 Tax=Bacillus massiliglaciei TaxID=1816693 RepID=UPI000A651AB8|nr:GNAT family N-acetyltransferase [Bacillus massiliglaciei]
MLIHKIDEDVSLRLFNEADAEEFYALTIRSKAYLKKWLGWLEHTKSAADTAQHIKAGLQEFAENGGHPKSFAILYQGKIAGTISFNTIDKVNRAGTIGYWLGEEFQGKGVMTKACKALIDYGFQELDLHRIEIRAAAENKKSRSIPERLGFTEEGRVREAEWLYDHYVDHIVYGLLESEWN